MTTQVIPIPTKAIFRWRPFQKFWSRTRIVDVSVLELIDVQEFSLCDRKWLRNIAKNRELGQSFVAVAARRNDVTIAGAVMEVRDKTGVVRLFHVDDAWRRRGVGRRLLRGLLARARFQLITKVFRIANAADAGFYALQGFRPVDANNTDGRLDRLNLGIKKEHASDSGAQIVLQRRLSSALMNNSPIDGIAMKL